MFPQTKGLGLQVSYGVNGNRAIVPTSPSSSQTLPFPKIMPAVSAEEPQLNIVSGRSRVIVQKQGHSTPENDNKSKEMEVAWASKASRKLDDTVPLSLMKQLQSQSDLLNVSEVYDPTFGQLIEFFSISRASANGKGKQAAVAYVSGTTAGQGNILNVSLVEASFRDQKKDFEAPRFTKTVGLTVDNSIKQIEALKPLVPMESKLDDHILIRTDTKVYIIHVSFSQTVSSVVALSLVTTLDTSDFKGNSLAHVCWNGYFRRVFYVVDIKGYIFQVKLHHSVTPVVKELALKDSKAEDEKIFENSLELSRWRKLVVMGRKRLLVASRTKMSRIDVDTLVSDRIVTSETWSKIQDIVVPCWQDQYMFMLTSKEIIWLDISGAVPQRLLSWKHFLSDTDPSLRFNVYKVRSKFICLVHSVMSPLVYCCQFGQEENGPSCLSRPSLLFVSNPQEVPISSLALVEINKSFYRPGVSFKEFFNNKENSVPYEDRFGVFDLRQNFEINFNIVGYGESKKVAKETEKVKIDYESLKASVKQSSIRPYTKAFFDKLKRQHMPALIEQITKVKRNTENAAEDQELLDKFIGALESQIHSLRAEDVHDYKSVSQLAGVPDHIEATDQLDMSLQQFFDQVTAKGFEVKSIIDTYFVNSKLVKEPPALKTSIEALYRHLNINYYKRDEVKPQTRVRSVKEMATLMSLSSMKLSSPELLGVYEQAYSTNYAAANSSAKAILDDWDTNYDADEAEDTIDSQRATQSQRTQVDAPSIIITSQDPSQRRRKKKERKDLRRLLNSQFSSQGPSQWSSQPVPSQAPSSQVPKSQPQSSQAPSSSQVDSQATQVDQSGQIGYNNSSPVASQTSQSSPRITQRSVKRPSQTSQKSKKKKKKKLGFA